MPSAPEEEYFKRTEAEKLKAAQQLHVDKMKHKEKLELKLKHHMRCPKCGQELKEIVTNNVHVDKCFSCGGIWLDEGELEEITKDSSNSTFAKIVKLLR